MMPLFQLFLLILVGKYASGWLFGCSGFKCRGGRCIRDRYVCDGDNDCGNWDDEDNCRRCSRNAFYCKNRNCRPRSVVCNGRNECGNWADEDSCRVQVRLVPGPHSGRLEVKARGEWGTVCNDGFSYNDAKVVCTSLGLESTFAKVVKATRGLGRIWMDNVGCSGGESSLDQCSHNGWGIHNCDHWNDVGVTCHSSVPTRLSSWNSNAYYGRVEVYVKGSWGTVCRDMFGRSDAKVVCRSLGQPTVYVEVISVSSGIGPIWMDDVGCSGHEASLSACRHRGWGVENCGHYQDVGVKCLSRDPNLCMSSQYTCSYGHCISSSRRCNGYNNCGDWTDENYCYRCSGGAFNCGNRRCRPKSITCNGVNDCGNWRDEDLCDVPSRLVPGPREGRLEVQRRGEWGTVCSHSFTYQDAKVACRSLGYAVAYAQVVLNAGLGQGSGMIWLDDVECSGQESSVDKCSHRSWGNHNCHHGNDVGVRCPSFAPTRLVSGRVEVYRHGVWGTVCGDGFTHIEGKVVCRVLGLEPMYVEVVRKSRSRSQTTLLSDLDCFGNEASFDQCNKTWGSSSCDRHRQIGVKCNSYAPVRLLPGPSEGRLEVYRDGVWATVCDANFTYNDAKVVCKYLGLKYDYAMSKENSFEQTSETVRLNNVSCDGHESSLSQCSHGGWAYKECKQSQVVAMVCYSSIPLRIVPGPREGRLEVYRRGQWGAVCADYFTYNIAKVICRSVGYQGEYAEVMTNLSANQMKIMVNRFSCSGWETSLGSCSLSLSSGNCGQISAGVACHSTEQHRLVPGPTEGRVHLYRGGSWGAVCDLSFTYKDARVVCTAINLPVDYAQVYNAGGPGTDSGTIWLSEVQCDGNETLLSECRHSNWGKGTCRNKQHLGAKCGSLSPVRLVPGPAAGRVEVYRQGVWGTVCQQNFTYINAKVVCQQLGLESAFAEVVNASKYGKGVKTWLSEVICSGNESSLSECKHAGWGEGNCSQDRDVGVVCHTSAPSRLVPSPRRGRLELYQAGAWGTVCSVGFSHIDARVACRGLGLTSAYAMVVSNSSKQTNRRALLANIGCSGQEEVLDVCAHDVWGGTYCNYPDVEIECPLYAPTRLVPGTRSGRVEVYRHGQWGTVCGDGFDHLEGQVVCRDLGLKVEYAEVKRDRRQIGTPLLTDLRCGGNESSLSSCLHKGWGPLACISNKTVQVTCHEDIPTRLVPGPLQGRLEVYKEGIWGTVCDNGFGTVDARVVCRALNLPMDFIRAVPNAGMSQGSGKVWMTYVGCSGNETALNRCSNSNWRTCSHSRDVGVMCHAVSVRMDNFFTYENVDTRLDCILQSTIAPPFEYTWSVGEVERSSGQTPYILWSFSKHDNSKRVFCQVNKDGYKVGDDNVDAVIFYPPPPVVFMSKKVIEGDDVTVGNPSDCNPPPYSYSVQNLQQGLNVTHLYHHHVIRNIPQSASGNYIVTLRNRMYVSQGVARDGYGVQVISINVLYHPRIQCKDKYIVYRGSDVKLSCLIDALPFPDTFTWSDSNYYRSLKVSRKGDNVEALIDNVQSHASGWYICETYNTMRTSSGKVRTGTGSCRTSLNVLYGPPLLEKRSVTVVEGDTVTLTFYVDCNPPVQRYRWKKSNLKSQYQSSNSPPVLTNIRRSEAGDYIVNVINFMNVTEGVPREGHGVQIITVRVHYHAEVYCENQYIVPINGKVNLTCSANSEPSPSLVMWSMEGRYPNLHSGPDMFFHIRKATLEDAGVYTCTVVNYMTNVYGLMTVGAGVCKTNLTVLSQPPSATVYAFEREDVFLSLPAPPKPALYMYEWKRLSSEIFKKSYRPMIHNVQRSDAGQYIVRLKKKVPMNIIMKDIYQIQRIVKVVILYKPQLTCQDHSSVYRGSDVKLTCFMDASPAAYTYSWSRIVSGQFVKPLDSVLYKDKVSSQITNTQSAASGQYKCEAINTMRSYSGEIKTGTGSCVTSIDVLYGPSSLEKQSITAFEGNDVTLSSVVDCNPPVHLYRWKESNSQSEYQSSNSAPIITNIGRSEAGDYIINVINFMNVTEGVPREGHGVQIITVRVHYPPKVRCPREFTALEDTIFTLTCPVDSSPPPDFITWTRGSLILQNGTQSQLVIHRAQRAGTAGLFTCTATNSMVDYRGMTRSGVASCNVIVHVAYPPPPQLSSTIDVFEGKAVRVFVPVDSNPAPHVYQWRKDIVGSTFRFSSIPPEITNVSRSDAGDYIVKVTNKMNITGSGEREGHGVQLIKLRVLYPPTIFCQKDYVILEYQPFNITCEANSFPASNLTWSKERQVLKAGSSHHLTLSHPSRMMSGMYTCTATNNMTNSEGVSRLGTEVCRMKLTVLYPAPILTRHYMQVQEGKTVTLMFPVRSNPPPHLYEWKKVGEPYFKVGTKSPRFDNIQRSDAGVYIIRLTNQLLLTEGDPREGRGLQLVNLNVSYPPEVSCQTPQVIHINTTFQLHCEVDSFPSASFVTWSKEGRLIQNGSQHYLEIKHIQTSDSGVYTCAAYNQLGLVSKSFGTGSCNIKVTVVYPPPPLTCASISMFEGSNVTLSQPVFSYPQPYSYEWKLRDTLSDYRSSDEPPVLTNIQRTEAGTYMIRIRNKLPVTQGAHRDGQGMQFIHVKVLYSPEVSCNKQHVVLRDSKVNLTCQVDSFPRPKVVTWYWSGSNGTVKKGMALFLTVESVQPNQSGMYTCSIYNVMEDSVGVTEFGNVSCSMSVEVVYPPPPEVTRFLPVFESDNVTVSLPPNSAPPPHVYSWRKEGETTQFTDSPSPPTLHNISRSESGLYTIKVINNLNLTQEKPSIGLGKQIVTVDVLFGPELTCLTDVYFLRGSTSVLAARVESNPKPSSVTWGLISKANIDTGFTPDVVTQQSSTLTAVKTFDKTEAKSILYLEEEGLLEVSTKQSNTAVKTEPMKTDSIGSGLSAKEVFYSGEGSGNDIYESQGYHTASGKGGLLEANRFVGSGEGEFGSSGDIEIFQNTEWSGDKMMSAMGDSTLSHVKRDTRSKVSSTIGIFTQQNEGLSSNMVQSSGSEDVFSGHDNSLPEQISYITLQNRFTNAGGAEPHDNDVLFNSEEESGSGGIDVEHISASSKKKGSYDVSTQQEIADINVIEEKNKETHLKSVEPLENELMFSDNDESGSGGIEVEHISESSKYEDLNSESDRFTASSWHGQPSASQSGSGDDLESYDASGISVSGHDANRILWTIEHSGEFSGSGLASGDLADDGNSSFSLEVSNITDTTMKHETVREGFVQYEKFYLTDIQSSDEGVYEFNATNIMVDYTGKERNETASCSINLHVLYPPPREMFASKTVFEGSDVLLSLPPDCLPLPSSYRWRKEDPGINLITDITPLVINNTSREDAGSYVIEVTNKMNLTNNGVQLGRGLQHVTLVVLYGPEVSCINYVVKKNFTVTLSCNIEAVPSPSSITWSRDDVTIHKGSKYLRITNIKTNDAGQYRCDVTSTLVDSVGRSESRSASCFSNVTVLSPPIPLQSRQLEVLEDEELPLSLPDPCLPAPHLYTWRRVSPSTGPLHQTTSPPLLLHTRPADAGLYFVKLSNRMDVTHGESSEGHGVQFVSVKVLFKPTIYCQEEYIIDEYSLVTMFCSVSHAMNSSTLTWYRGLEYIGNQSSVTITNATESHIGTYTCSVSTTLVDSRGRIRSWTSICSTKLSVINGFKASTSPFRLFPPHLLPYIIYIGGSILVFVFVILLVAAVRVRGSQSKKGQQIICIKMKTLSRDRQETSDSL